MRYLLVQGSRWSLASGKVAGVAREETSSPLPLGGSSLRSLCRPKKMIPGMPMLLGPRHVQDHVHAAFSTRWSRKPIFTSASQSSKRICLPSTLLSPSSCWFLVAWAPALCPTQYRHLSRGKCIWEPGRSQSVLRGDGLRGVTQVGVTEPKTWAEPGMGLLFSVLWMLRSSRKR